MKIFATIVAALAIYFAISISPSDALAFATSFVSPDMTAVVTRSRYRDLRGAADLSERYFAAAQDAD